MHIGYVPIRIGGGEFGSPERTMSPKFNALQVWISPLKLPPTAGVFIPVVLSQSVAHGFKLKPPTRTSPNQIDKFKIAATCFIRALSAEHGTTAQILREFFETKVKNWTGTAERVISSAPSSSKISSTKNLVSHWFAPEQLTEGQFETLKGLGIKKVEVITDDVKADDVAEYLRDDEAQSYEEALVRIYRRLRPGNPADEAKVKNLLRSFPQ